MSDYGSSYDYVTKYENNDYAVYSYKDLSCLKKKANEASQVDFGDCYTKVQHHYGFEDEDLIISIASSKGEKTTHSFTFFYFSNPRNGSLLDANEVCADAKIVVSEDVMSLMESLDDEKEEYIIFLTEQGVDVFNISDEFYNDLCYHFESPNGKDVPMKDRMTTFYPNITLCDPGCENKGVDLETMKAICECFFNNLMNNDLMNNLYGEALGEAMDMISSLNIAVFQCVGDIFDGEQIKKCTGGFIVLGLLSGQLTCMVKFLFDGLYAIRKFIFSLQESFSVLMKKSPIPNPPLKKKLREARETKSNRTKIDNSPSKIHSKSSKNVIKDKNFLKKKFKDIVQSTNEDNDLLQYKKNYRKSSKKKINAFQTDADKISEEESSKDLEKIKELLSNSFDETDFDDSL